MRSFAAVIIILISSALASAQTANDFFDTNVLQEIRLDVNPADWQTLKANPGSDTYYQADFHWRTMTVTKVGIRQRGASTRNGVKPGLRIDFNRFTSGQTFLGLSAAGLDNNGQDASMMKERMVMETFTKLGMPAAREVSTKL